MLRLEILKRLKENYQIIERGHYNIDIQLRILGYPYRVMVTQDTSDVSEEVG